MTIAGRLIYATWSLLWGTAITSIHALLYMVAFAARRVEWAVWVEGSFARSLLGGLGVHLLVEGRENIPPGRSFVAMSNHQSYLDIPALFLSLRPAVVVFVAKRELGRIPLLGWAIASSHHVKVDRGNREQAVAALQESIRKIKSGVALGVFAEGTRSPDLRLLPFKKGGFYVAVDSGLPIVPVSLSGSGRLFGKRTRLPRRGTIRVRIHPVVTPGSGGRAEIPALLQTVRAAILSGVPEATEARPEPRATWAAVLALGLLAIPATAQEPGTYPSPPRAQGTTSPWEALDRDVDVLARAVGVPAERFRVDPAACDLLDSYTGRLRLERYLLGEPRRTPATLDALAAELLGSNGVGPKLELLSQLAWTRSIVPRPLDIETVRLPTDTLKNPVESAMERLYAGTGKRFQGKERVRVVQESRRLPPVVQRQLAGLLDAIVRANRLRDAVAKSSDLKQGGVFDSKSRKTATRLREYLLRWGEPGLESDESMSRILYSLGTVNLDVLYTAASELARTVDHAADSLASGIPAVQVSQMEWVTPLGRIGVGGDGNDIYRGSYALVLDTGGSDVYQGPGGTSGQDGVCLVVDLAGDDRYEPADSAMAGPGGAVLGFAGIVDLRGNDAYGGTAWSGGFGFLGTGWIHDRAGDDTYRMQWQSLGAGHFGLGLLVDEGGKDEYGLHGIDAAFPLGQGQGFGGPLGMGVLLDAAGDDGYVAAEEDTAAAWSSDATWVTGSFVQGAARGAGARWAGGFGFLADGGGNDHYRAPGCAQGFGDGAGLGVLADRSGNDMYTATSYAMGSGRRLGVGLLLESAGNDVYEATAGARGAGEDLGMGVLADGAGDDRYPAASPGSGAGPPTESSAAFGRATWGLGSAFRQGAGWLLDAAGEDSYPPALLCVEPGVTEPWRAPVPGVGVWLDLEQSRAGIPRDLESVSGPESNPGSWLLVPWRGTGPGVGGGLVRHSAEDTPSQGTN